MMQGWLETPLGAALLRQEMRIVEEAFDGIFGEYCLQMGLWGESRTFLRFARTQRSALIAPELESGACAVGELHRLPVETDSVDAVLLPHTLERSDRPHAVLREVDRILRRDGRLIILGFKPGGLWGLRRLLPGKGVPPGIDQPISDRRIKDWLKLLDMRIDASQRYFFRWPIGARKPVGPSKWERRGKALWPELAACYMLSAQKRMSVLTPVRPLWRRPQVVAGLAESQTRVSKIRFDPKH